MEEKPKRKYKKKPEYTKDGRLKRPMKRRPLIPGKQPKYTDPQDMLDKVNEYFEEGYQTKTVILGRGNNKYEHTIAVYGIIDLALYLGFASRVSLFHYSKKNPEFADVVAYAKSMVSRHYEGLLQAGVSPSGMIFMLANIDGMVMQQDVGLEMQKPIQSITFSRKTVNNNVKVLNSGELKTLPKTDQVVSIKPKVEDKSTPNLENILGISDLD